MAPQHFQTVPGVDADTATALHIELQARLSDLIDLQLALKHAHWNLVGPTFQSIHESLDTHVTEVRAMSDAVAERTRTLGGTPRGTARAVAGSDTIHGYGVDRGYVVDHLRALDDLYTHVILGHRRSIDAAGGDPVTEDLLIGQTAQLELLQWFVRSSLEGTEPSAVDFDRHSASLLELVDR